MRGYAVAALPCSSRLTPLPYGRYNTGGGCPLKSNGTAGSILTRHLIGTLLLVCAIQIAHPSTAGAPAPWTGPLVVGLAASADDQRLPLVHEAIRYWNNMLDEIGATFRLGPVLLLKKPDAAATLRQMSAGKLADSRTLPYPSFMEALDMGLLLILSDDAGIVSFAEHWEDRAKALIVIKSAGSPPLSLPNVTRNVIAHELGHVIGLEHNSDGSTLMCGRPALCRPEDFASASARFLPLTAEETALLRELYARRNQPSWVRRGMEHH